MTTFLITANGVEMGSYEGATEREAIIAYVQDAGYETVAEAAAATGQTEAGFLAEIIVRKA